MMASLALGDDVDELGLELRPREVPLLVQLHDHPERPHLPRLAEGQLALLAGDLAGPRKLADQALDVAPLGRPRRTVRRGAWAPAHRYAFGSGTTPTPIIESRVTSSASSSSDMPSVPGGRCGSTQ